MNCADKPIVCKFGGSSLSDAECFRSVARIIIENDLRRVIIVSAPGKRYTGDVKITDLLFSLCRVWFDEQKKRKILDQVYRRFDDITMGLGVAVDIETCFDLSTVGLEPNVDYIVSRGEYLSSKILATFLGFSFIDPTEIIFLDKKGKIDENRTKNAVRKLLNRRDYCVIPGFYASGFDGKIKLLPRGGSDLTGAILSAFVGACKYENWTDVSGVYPIDPRLYSIDAPVKRLSYRSALAVCRSGANVLSAESVEFSKKHNVQIVVKNTFRPRDKGTVILKNPPRSDFVLSVSLAGKENGNYLLNIVVSKDNGKIKKSIINALSARGVDMDLKDNSEGFYSVAVPQGEFITVLTAFKEVLSKYSHK